MTTAAPKPASRTLLIVDDEPLFARALRDDLSSTTLEVIAAATAADALRVIRERQVDVVLLDQHLPDARGFELCPAFLDANGRTKIIFITAHPDFAIARAAIQAGAIDYLSKPCELEEIRLVVARCLKTIDLERKESVAAYNKSQLRSDAALLGSSTSFQRVRELVDVAAKTDSPVLLTGETGTGKSVVARAIHFGSARRDGELVSINCAALPEGLIEAELFGHERGAFTGAGEGREGLFEMAEHGSLLLDEIGEMPLALQSRLLHVLDDGAVRRVGGRTSRRVDFRLLAATNSDLDLAVRERRFREDLYYRLDVLRIQLPPLCERADDISELAAHFLSRIGGADARLAPGEERLLAAYPWPGNLRELRNVLERAWLLRGDGPVRPSAFLGGASAPASNDPEAPPLSPLAAVERAHVERVVRHTEGNLTRAARILGISVSTLRRKLKPATASK